jgi:hypothetical protein
MYILMIREICCRAAMADRWNFLYAEDGTNAMNLTIELPDELGAALKAQAQVQGVSADRYISRVLEHTLTSGARAEPPPNQALI